jgi:hypothetical protein
MSYPQEGIILNSESKTVAGTCGNAIKEKPGASGELNLVFDNFFGITSTTWPGSIESFIRHGDPNGYITYAPIEGTNADEAVSITGVIRDSEILPLGNAFSLYKKGSKIFTIRHLPNAENVNGCIYINRDLPTFFKAENYPGVSIEEYTKLHKAHVAWNIPASFKFTKATTQPTTKAEQTAICTMDAKICADGTTVGRTGSKCEFVCPGGKASQ